MRAVVLSIVCCLLGTFSLAQEPTDWTYVRLVGEDALEIEGEINGFTEDLFNVFVEVHPGIRHVLLNSPGGYVRPALAIAETINQRRMNTIIRGDAVCTSACAWIFVAGDIRDARGILGVHQMSAPWDNNSLIQYTIGDILDRTRSFDVPDEFLVASLRTPPEEIYIFTSGEINRMGLYASAWRPVDQPELNDPELFGELDYIDQVLVLTESYFQQVQPRELYEAQVALNAFGGSYDGDLDGG